MKKNTNFIFDLDGTLIDSRNDIISSIKYACKDYINDLSIFDNIAIGKPIKKILKKYIEDEKIIDQIVLRFRNKYDNMDPVETTIYKRVSDIIKLLKNNGNKVYILTNKPIKPTVAILKHFCIYEYFDFIYCIDSFKENYESKKERLKHLVSFQNMNVKNTIYTGDTLEDIEAAKYNNIISVAAIWGYEENKEKLMEEADFWLQNFNFEGFEILTDKLLSIKQMEHYSLTH